MFDLAHYIVVIFSLTVTDPNRLIMDVARSDPANVLVLPSILQGTVLGPFFTLSYLDIYINDLPQFVSQGTSFRLFVDDSALCRKITNFNHFNKVDNQVGPNQMLSRLLFFLLLLKFKPKKKLISWK